MLPDRARDYLLHDLAATPVVIDRHDAGSHSHRLRPPTRR